MYPNVEAERTRAGLTLDPIASAWGVSVPTASLKLNGKAPITFKEAKILKDLIVEEKTKKNISVNIDMSLEVLFEEAV